VKDPGISFSQTTYDPCLGETMDLSSCLTNPNSLSISYAVNNANIASISNNVLTTRAIGKGTLTATYNADANYAKGTATATIDIYRRDLNPSLEWTSKTMKAWETINMPTLQDMPSDYRPTWNQCTYSSSDESVVKPTGNSAKLIFGGSGYGKTATITITIPQTNKYNEKKLTYTVTVDNEMRIGSKADWQTFVNFMQTGKNTNVNVTMTADVDLGTDIITWGSTFLYSGTFDGGGHTLSLNWTATGKTRLAPFTFLGNATIKNLHTKGQITAKDADIAGLASSSNGTTTITKCISEVNLTGGSSSKYSTWTICGMVSRVYGGTLTFNDCLVLGNIHTTTNKDEIRMNGFTHYENDKNGTSVMNNCLYAGNNNGGAWANTFASHATLNNSYYLNACGTAQGTQVTAEQLKSGEVPYLLQNGRTDNVWGQTIGTDTEPQPTADAAKHIYKVDFTYNDKVVTTRYANTGKGINGTLPTLQEILGSSYDAHHYYTLAFDDGFNTSTAVTADKTVAVTLTDKEYFEIATADDWKAFCDLVNGGQITVDAKLTKNIDLGSNVWMIGNYGNHYSGTFDGDGHTLSLNWNISKAEAAPFFYTSGGATIKNLHTKGQITTDFQGTSGLIDRVVGKTTISGCISEVDITSSYAYGGACGASGLVYLNAYQKGDLTITDCIVKGTFNATDEGGSWGMSGFVYSQEAVCTISNSLYLGSNNGGVWSRTFAKNATITNCYYLNPCGTAQGTQVTEDQLKSGEVAHLLQGDRTDQFWGQMLGAEDAPLPTADATRRVYKVTFKKDEQLLSTRYANQDKSVYGALPVLEGLMDENCNDHYYYTMTFADDFNASTPVTGDKDVVVTLVEHEYYDIATKDDWKAFCALVNGGRNVLNGRLTADIDLGYSNNLNDIWAMKVGENNIKYGGTFDGGGHSITLNWNLSSGIYLFEYIQDAIIRNVIFKGQMNGTNSGYGAPIGNVFGTNTISKCVGALNITITSTSSQSANSGGLVQSVRSGATLTLNDCMVTGSFNGTNSNAQRSWGGFIQYSDGNCILNNCLYLGTNNVTDWSGTFVGSSNGDLTLNHCFYLNSCGKLQGTQVTEKQLKNGEVTNLLQAGRTDQCYWAQQLGEMPSFYDESKVSNANYVYYNNNPIAQNWQCELFKPTECMPAGLQFYAYQFHIDRSFTASKAYTVVLPYDWKQVSSADDKVYTLKKIDGDVALFSEVSRADDLGREFPIPFSAYQPYLVIPQNDMDYLDCDGVWIEAEPVANEGNGIQWCATYTSMSNAEAAAAGAYILQSDGQFHKVTAGDDAVNIPPYRAYLTLSETREAKPLALLLEGETTDIRTIETTDRDGTVRYYDMQGRYIGTTLDGQPKGVYIKDGKKTYNSK